MVYSRAAFRHMERGFATTNTAVSIYPKEWEGEEANTVFSEPTLHPFLLGKIIWKLQKQNGKKYVDAVTPKPKKRKQNKTWTTCVELTN